MNDEKNSRNAPDETGIGQADAQILSQELKDISDSDNTGMNGTEGANIAIYQPDDLDAWNTKISADEDKLKELNSQIGKKDEPESGENVAEAFALIDTPPKKGFISSINRIFEIIMSHYFLLIMIFVGVVAVWYFSVAMTKSNTSKLEQTINQQSRLDQ